nr:isoform 2 of serine/arginine repetitive matrix protein 1 [Quercus suber]
MSAALTTDVTEKLLRTTKFPPEFNEKVDMSKVRFTVLRMWVVEELMRIMKYEDEIVLEMIFDRLSSKDSPDIRRLQIYLGGFLDKDAAPFCLKLWQMCLSAQENAQGIPQELLEAKKAQLVEEEAAREARLARRREEEELQAQRERDRRDRGRDGGRGGRGGRDFDRRPPPRDYSRSPPPRRRDRNDDSYYRAPPRNIDSYVPAGGRSRIDRASSPPPPRRTRNRAPSYSSRSRSPPRRRRRRSPSLDRSSRSRSRTPPRRRYRARSRSPRPRRYDRRGGATQHRSQQYRPDSRSPRRDDSRSRTRTPPRKRRRSSSPSHSPPIKREASAPSDLVTATRTTDKRRLSREPSVEPDRKVKVEKEYHFRGVASRQNGERHEQKKMNQAHLAERKRLLIASGYYGPGSKARRASWTFQSVGAMTTGMDEWLEILSQSQYLDVMTLGMPLGRSYAGRHISHRHHDRLGASVRPGKFQPPLLRTALTRWRQVRKQLDDIADGIERHFDLVAGQLREWTVDSGLIPSRPAPRRLPPPSTLQMVERWISKHRVLTAAMVAFVLTGSVGALVYVRSKNSRRRRRARKSESGARTEVVVVAGAVANPLTSALYLDLERRGFIVYVMANTPEDAHYIRAQSRIDLLPLHLDLTDPFHAQDQLARFTTLLAREHAAFEGAEPHRLKFVGLVVVPDTRAAPARVEDVSMEEWSDVLNA